MDKELATDNDSLLDELNGKYLDEILEIFPIHRILFLAVLVPVVLLALTEETEGLTLSLARFSPLQTLRYDNGIIWQQPWLAWGVMVICYLVAVFSSTTIQRCLGWGLSHSKHRSRYIDRIKLSAHRLSYEISDTSALREALIHRFEIRKKALLHRLRASEIAISTAILMVIFSYKWDALDVYVFVSFAVFGVLFQILNYNFYIAKVAPSWLLHGFLSNSFVQLEDGIDP